MKSCLNVAKCDNKTIGTTTLGSQLKGKYPRAMYVSLKAKCWKGDFVENSAMRRMLISKPKLKKFQTNKPFLEILFFTKHQ